MNAHVKPVRDNQQARYLPQAVVEKATIEGKSLVQAWREYKHMSPHDLACRMRVTETVLQVFERSNNHLSNAAIKKIAAALEVSEEQLRL